MRSIPSVPADRIGLGCVQRPMRRSALDRSAQTGSSKRTGAQAKWPYHLSRAGRAGEGVARYRGPDTSPIASSSLPAGGGGGPAAADD